MIALQWNPSESQADIVLENGTIKLDDGLESAVLISLFTDARARDDDDMTGLVKDKRGWWADTFADTPRFTGSRIWVRRRSGITTKLLADIRQDAQGALSWLVDDGVASVVNVATERFGTGGVMLSVEITKPGAVSPRWFKVWEMRFYGV